MSTKLRQALTALGEARILEQKTANAGALRPARRRGRDGAGRRRHQRRASRRRGASCRRSFSATPRAPSIATRAAPARRRATSSTAIPTCRAPRRSGSIAVIVDVRSERVREVTITHPDGEVVRLSKTGAELANFEVADVPNGRELSYPGVANVVGNALRELNLEDVEPAGDAPADGPPPHDRRVSDLRRARRANHRHRAQRRSWITLEASADAAAAAAAAPAAPAADGAAPAAAAPIRTPRRRASTPKSAAGATRSPASNTTR